MVYENRKKTKENKYESMSVFLSLSLAQKQANKQTGKQEYESMYVFTRDPQLSKRQENISEQL